MKTTGLTARLLFLLCVVCISMVAASAQGIVYDEFKFADPMLAEDPRNVPVFSATLIGPEEVALGEEQTYAVEIDNKGERLLINNVRLSIVTLDTYGRSNEIADAEDTNLDTKGYRFETTLKIVGEQLASGQFSLLLCVFGETGKITREPGAYFQHCSLTPLNYRGARTQKFDIVENPFSQYIDYLVITPSNGLMGTYTYGGYTGFYTYYYGGELGIVEGGYAIPDANRYVSRIISLPRVLFMGTVTPAEKFIKGGVHSESQEPYFNEDYSHSADSYFYLVDEVPLKRHMFPFHSAMVDSETAEYLLYVPQTEARRYWVEGRYFGTNKTTQVIDAAPYKLAQPVVAGTEKKPVYEGGTVPPTTPPSTGTGQQPAQPGATGPGQPLAQLGIPPTSGIEQPQQKPGGDSSLLIIVAAAVIVIVIVILVLLLKKGKIGAGAGAAKTAGAEAGAAAATAPKAGQQRADKVPKEEEKKTRARAGGGKFCSKCGAQIEKGSVFCGNCGQKI